MKKLFSVNNSEMNTSIALLIIRIGIALLMLTHGIPKLVMLLSGSPVQFPPVMGISAEISLGLTIFAEVICSIFMLFGFATRLSALFLAFTMVIAAFVFHAADPFATKEPALLYLLAYLVLIITGSGKYSIDHLLFNKSIANKEEQVNKHQVVYN